MDIQVTKTISVLPILIKDSSEDNAKIIARCILNQGSDRNIKIHDYHIVKEGLIILLTGNIGNSLDNLLIKLSGIENKIDEIAYCELQRALKIVNTINDKKYKNLLKDGYSKYFNLDSDLTCIYN